MSMRSGASVCQLFAVSSVPRAARTVRAGAVGASVMSRSHRTRHPATTDARGSRPGSQTQPGRQSAALGEVSRAAMPRAAMNGTASTAVPSRCTSKWRWHPVDAPVLPTAPMSCPATTVSPGATNVPPAARCA